MPDQPPPPARVERELLLPAPPAMVWKVVTGSGWLAPEVRLELVPGGEASFWSDDWAKSGWIEEAIAPNGADGRRGRLVFWWSAAGEPGTRVELTLEPDGDEATRLRVVEARLLETLDLADSPLPGTGGPTPGPAMLLAA